MSRLIAFVAVVLLAVPAYGQCSFFGGRSYSPVTSYNYGGCAPVVSYGNCGSYSYGYVVRPTYYNGCGSYVVQSSDCGTTSSAVQKVEKATPLPPDYYKETTPLSEPTPAVEEPTPAQEEEKPEAPAESFQATSFTPTSLSVAKPVKMADAVIELHVSPTAQVWINGRKTNMTGSVRRYISKDLIEGKKYTYNILVDDNGRRGQAVAVLTAGQKKVLR